MKEGRGKEEVIYLKKIHQHENRSRNAILIDIYPDEGQENSSFGSDKSEYMDDDSAIEVIEDNSKQE